MRGELPPGPRSPAAWQMAAWWARPLPFFERCRRKYGRRFTIRLVGTPPFVMLAEPEQLKVLFATPAKVLHAGEALTRLEPLVGPSSVIVLDEEAHLRRRRTMLPALHGDGIARLGDFVRDAAEREISSWPRGAAFETHPGFQAIALDVILRAVFGMDRGPGLDRMRRLVTEILTFSERPALLATTGKDVFRGHGPLGRFFRVRRDLDDVIYQQIRERRAEGPGRDDILALLLDGEKDDGSRLSDQEIRDELMSTLIAGHETTASQMSWTAAQIAREPRVVDRLTEELDAGDESYLDAVIQEAMRRRPVLPNAEPRLLTEPFELGDWSYPAGVCLVPNPYLVHHDPEFFPDPYSFSPERFLVEKPPRAPTYIPFGGGPRRCPGAAFAMVEMRIVFRLLLENDRVEAVRGPLEIARRRAITVKPRGGGRVRLARRARQPTPVAV